MRVALLAGAASAALSGCAGPPSLSPRVVRGLDDMPLLGGDSLLVSVERDGLPIQGASVLTALPTTSFELPHVPLGSGLSLRVEARAGDVVLARGRSFPFDYPSADRPPVAPPDVLLGTLGRFTRTLETSEAIVALAPTGEGAIAVTAEGRVLAYLAHGAADGSALLEERGLVPERAGASWASLPTDGSASAPARLLGVGGAAPGATLLDVDGMIAAELGPSELRAMTGVALATSSDGAWALAIGGRDGTSTAVADVIRIDVGTGLAARAMPPLDAPTASATAVPVQADDGTALREVVIVGGGWAPGALALIDPMGAPVRTIAIEPVLAGRAMVALETGLLAAAGGTDAMGAASDAVDLYLVRLDREPPVARITPMPPRLFAARTAARAIRLGPGLALIVGGADAAGVRARGGELLEVRLGSLPGVVVPTGALPVDATVHAGARLLDRSVVVVGDGLVASYIAPRGPD